MPFAVPQPGDIASRASGVFEAEFSRIYALKNPSAPPATVDARSAASQLAVYARTVDMSAQDMWAFLAYLSLQAFVTKATDFLTEQAAIWGIPRNAGTYASGSAIFTAGPAAVDVPSGFALSFPGGLSYQTTEAVTVPANGTADIPIACTVLGSQGSLAAGAVLQVVNPIAGLAAQTATVDSNGIVGADAESIDAWRARILAEKRRGNGAGAAADLERWVQQALPGALVKAWSPGIGLATVAFAMPTSSTVVLPSGTQTTFSGWRAPSSAEIATAQAYLSDAGNRKPLGQFPSVIAANLVAQNFTVHLVPDTVANRDGAVTALTQQILADATIGGTIYRARLDAALVTASGEFADDLTAPTGDWTGGPADLAVIGTVTFA